MRTIKDVLAILGALFFLLVCLAMAEAYGLVPHIGLIGGH